MTTLTADQMKPLCGWKSIAVHLGVSETTARRYWRESKLPVRKERGSMRTTVGMLDEWERKRMG